MPPLEATLREVGSQFWADLAAAAPRVASGVVFLVAAGIVVKLLLVALRVFLRRTFRSEDLYVQFASTVAAVFLWFGVALTFLSIVGLDGIAVALGTASGFLALGVSYALSGMIADAVAGVYLLRDPDFNPGDRVDVGGTVGTVHSIELRKTRLEVEDGTVVRGNAEIEKKWTKFGEPGRSSRSDT